MARLTKSEKIIAIDLEIEQLSNQKKQLEAQERERARKERTTRLCKRAGLLESLLPNTIALTEDNFKLFLEKTVANDFGRRTLAAIGAENAEPAAARTTETQNHGATS